jgi:hypothetical protein
LKENSVQPHDNGQLETILTEGVEKASESIKSDSLSILCRKPLLDEDCPEVSDIDLTVIYDKTEEYPERRTVDTKNGRVFVDLLWVPISQMLDSDRAATYKILPHLLLESDIVWLKSNTIKLIIDNIKVKAYDITVWQKRIHNQIIFGNAALEEAYKNLDFPPAAVFFVQTAHSYYLMGLADCLKISTMSILTKPITKVNLMAAAAGDNLERILKNNLFLETEPAGSLNALEKVYNIVNRRCNFQKPKGVTKRTLGHYTYSISSLEFDYRQMVIESLIAKGDYMNANFYLRFWAYSLSRCPVVLEEANKGNNPSFYVPFRPFNESIENYCPEILDHMKVIFGDVTLDEARESIKGTIRFKQLVIDKIQSMGLNLKNV